MATQTSQYDMTTINRQKYLSKKDLKTLAEAVDLFRERRANQQPILTARGFGLANQNERPISKYYSIMKKYEPVLQSSAAAHHSRDRKVPSDCITTQEMRRAAWLKKREIDKMSKEQIEEAKVKEMLYERMKKQLSQQDQKEETKFLPSHLLPAVYANHYDEPKKREYMSAQQRNPILGKSGEYNVENSIMLKPLIDKAIQKAREERKSLQKSDRPSLMMNPSAGILQDSEESEDSEVADLRKRQRDKLRKVKSATPPPPPVKEVTSIAIQTSTPIHSATGDRYSEMDGLLEPFSKDQATSTYEDHLNDDIHISISSRDNITSPPHDHQIYKRTRDSPTGRYNRNNSKIPQPTASVPPQQPTPAETKTQKKKSKYDPPRKIIRKDKDNNMQQKNGTLTNLKQNGTAAAKLNETAAARNSVIPIRHVSKPGYEDVYVAIHGATSLPSCSDGRDPTPFASLKSGTEDRADVKATCTTHAAYQPTHSPTWEEAFTLQIPEDSVGSEDIVLSVADSNTKDQLVTYQIPIQYLEPFHTYHLELVQPTPSIPHGIRMYVTIQRKGSHLQRIQEFGYCALEVTLRDFKHELKTSPGSLLAVTRIVPDYTSYKERMLSRRPYAAGILPQIINFPSPGRHNFIPSTENSQGYPQLSLPSSAERQPEWGHTFLFSHNEAATMFSRRAAVVVEYYPASNMITPVTWAVKNPVGFSVVHLDELTLQALTSDPGRLGIRLDDISLQGSNYETVEGSKDPSVRLVLRLINTERPDTMVAAGNMEMLPPLDTLIPSSTYTPTPQMVADEYFQQKTPTPIPSLPPTPLSTGQLSTFGGDIRSNPNKILVKEDEFPPDDAIENILPEYALTRNDLQLYNVPTNSTILRPRAGPTRPRQQQNQPRPNLLNQDSDITLHSANSEEPMKSVLDKREEELNRYKDAVKRMSHDIVNLRQENLSLKSNNQVLRRGVNESKDTLGGGGGGLLTYRSQIPATNGNHQSQSFDPGLVDSAELAQELDAVNQKLAKDSLDLQKYKSKVQHLQNQVIKANEREKNLLSDQMTRSQMEDTINDLHKKVKKTHKLEETVLKQEQVILKMEDLLKKFQKKEQVEKEAAAKQAQSLPANEEILSSLTKQNNRLHLDLQKLKEDEGNEKSELKARLQRAENRASTLEQQLVRNAREWAREKQELTVRLQEHRNGIIRKSTIG